MIVSYLYYSISTLFEKAFSLRATEDFTAYAKPIRYYIAAVVLIYTIVVIITHVKNIKNIDRKE